MNDLKHTSTERYFEGIIVGVNDCAVVIELKGRLGQLKLPKRMVVSEETLKLGQEIGMLMSYPEVLSTKINIEYEKNYKKQLELEKE